MASINFLDTIWSDVRHRAYQREILENCRNKTKNREINIWEKMINK